MASAGEKEQAHVHHASAMRYVICWVLLAIGTILTYTMSNVELGAWSLAVAMLIAVSKATIVVLFFMHLWDHTGANRLVFVVSVFFVLVLIAIVIMDFDTRWPLSLPPTSARSHL